MKENFFADYKKFVVVPVEEKPVGKRAYDPKEYAAYYILTLSIFNSRLVTWKDANKYEIDIEKSVKKVLEDFNMMEDGNYHLQLLELDKFKNYFILALSSKNRFNPEEEQKRISDIVDRRITNAFYVGQNWFNFIGEKGRIERKLFCYWYKEYILEGSE
jgi:UTP-glucose-1-phosphate uridylyltransferase